MLDKKIEQNALAQTVVQVAGDYHECTRKDEINIGIIDDIFDFIFSEKISENPDDHSIPSNNKDKTIDLKIKIPINCKEDDQIILLKEMFWNNWSLINLVQKYIEDFDEQERVLRLKEFIQSQYRLLKNNNDDIIIVFDNLPNVILPESKMRNSDYYCGAKAIILFFFMRCDREKNRT